VNSQQYAFRDAEDAITPFLFADKFRRIELKNSRMVSKDVADCVAGQTPKSGDFGDGEMLF
jgi:hypothetical protein